MDASTISSNLARLSTFLHSSSADFPGTGLWLPYLRPHHVDVLNFFGGLTFLDAMRFPRGQPLPAPYNSVLLAQAGVLPPEVPSGTISFHWGTYRGVAYVSVTLGKAIGSPGALLKELDEQGACRRKMTAFLTSLQFSALGGTLIVDFDLTFKPANPLPANPKRKSFDRSAKSVTPVPPSSPSRLLPPSKKPKAVESMSLNSLEQSLDRLPHTTSSNPRSNTRDFVFVKTYLDKRRSDIESRLELLGALTKYYQSALPPPAPPPPSLASHFIAGVKELVSMSTGRGRVSMETRNVLHAIGACLVLGLHTGKINGATAIASCEPSRLMLGLSKVMLFGGIGAAVLMRETGAAYQQVVAVEESSQLPEQNAALLVAFQLFIHDNEMFPLDTNMAEVHMDHERRVYYEEVGGVTKRRAEKVGGIFHPGRSRCGFTLQEITDLFMISTYCHKCVKGKAIWTYEKTKEHICRYLKCPAPMVCVDPIKRNAQLACETVTKAVNAIIKKTEGRMTRRGDSCAGLLDLFKSPRTVLEHVLCRKKIYAGVDLYGEVFMDFCKECAYSTCNKCGVLKFFKERLDLDKLFIAKAEKLTMRRFEKVTRPWDAEVLELVTRDVTFEATLELARADLQADAKHRWKDRWRNQMYKVRKSRLGPTSADVRVDFAAGLAFCSVENVTCVPNNYGYLEVFFCSINRRMVGDTVVFTNIVFFFFGEASSKFKGNDVRAHEVHEAEVRRVLFEKYGITHINFTTDGCKGQYVSWLNITNLAQMKDKFGVTATMCVCEPACGKCSCDAANNVVSRIVKDCLKKKIYLPGPNETFEHCVNKEPMNAQRYQEWEEEGDEYKLKHNKGSEGHDVYMWYLNTTDKKKKEEMEKKHPGRILFTDRSVHVTVNRNNKVTMKDNRYYEALGSDDIGVQELPCECPGCVGEGEACLHDDISGRSRRQKVHMVRKEGVAYKVECAREQPNNEVGGAVEEKVVERTLVRTEVTESEVPGLLIYTNANCIATSIRPRNVVAFKCEGEGRYEGEGGGEWGAGVVTEVVEGGLKVDLLLRKGGRIVNEQNFAVRNGDVLLSSDVCPRFATKRIIVDAGTLNKIDGLL